MKKASPFFKFQLSYLMEAGLWHRLVRKNVPMIHESRLYHLLSLYVGGRISATETAELGALAAATEDAQLHLVLEQIWQQANSNQEIFSREETAAMLQLILQAQPKQGRVASIFRSKWLLTVAAALLVAGLFALYQYMASSTQPTGVEAEMALANDVAPGSNKAILILSDGKTITLDSAGNGILAADGSDKIVKTGDGIAYETGKDNAVIQYNTIQTPNGGEYFVELADGSKVWLNAASSLRYPTHFAGTERRVELTGEAYFEVAHNEKQPFRINVAGKGEVEVLGTSFDINSYQEEDGVRATLIDGKINFKMLDGSETMVQLAPGQQAQLLENGQLKVVKNVNVEEVVAWKEGQFYFESADLKTILRQFQRWYNIEVVYEGEISSRKYFAIISRNSTLAQVLKALQANEIKHRIEGRKLFIQSGS